MEIESIGLPTLDTTQPMLSSDIYLPLMTLTTKNYTKSYPGVRLISEQDLKALLGSPQTCFRTEEEMETKEI